MNLATATAAGLIAAIALTSIDRDRREIETLRAELVYQKSLHLADLDEHRRQQDDTLIQQFAIMRRMAEALEDKRDDDTLSHWGGKL